MNKCLRVENVTSKQWVEHFSKLYNVDEQKKTGTRDSRGNRTVVISQKEIN